MAYKNREDQLASQRRHYHKGDNATKAKNLIYAQRDRRRKYLYETLGASCCRCGSTKDLEFDHVNPGLKKTRQSFVSMGMVRLEKEIDNIQVLCHECHTERSNFQKKAAWKLFSSLPLEEQDDLLLKMKIDK